MGGGCKGLWQQHVQGCGNLSLGLGMHESGLGMSGFQGEDVDVAQDVWVVDGTCVIVGVIAAPAVLAAGASPVCSIWVAILVVRMKSG